MRTKDEYIQLLHLSDKLLTQQFGIRSLRLFGSVGRDEHTSESDVDICGDRNTQSFSDNRFGGLLKTN